MGSGWGGGDESSLRKGGMGMRGGREDVLREGCSGKEKMEQEKRELIGKMCTDMLSFSSQPFVPPTFKGSFCKGW